MVSSNNTRHAVRTTFIPLEILTGPEQFWLTHNHTLSATLSPFTNTTHKRPVTTCTSTHKRPMTTCTGTHRQPVTTLY